jgi:NADH-quinone oxidoreductase subunit H
MFNLTTADLTFIVMGTLKVFGIFSIYMLILTWLSWLERRVCAILQDRSGPNRVGPLGLLQPIADAIKLLQKEDLVPKQVEKILYILAPAFVAMPALVTFAVIPMGASIPHDFLNSFFLFLSNTFSLSFFQDVATVFSSEGTYSLAATDLPAGLLFLLAVGSMGVYGLALGAWSANNKYATMGGVRASAQMISYELTLGVAVVTLILMTGSATVGDMVNVQAGTFLGFLPKWNLFVNPVTSIILVICLFAETNRLPFDFPEAEPELIAGYHIEHAGMKFALFMIGESAAMLTASALIVTLVLGGWHFPGYESAMLLFPVWMVIPLTVGVFLLKLFFVLLLFIVVRWSIPRFRYDQLMFLGWKRLLPASLICLFLTVVIKEMVA